MKNLKYLLCALAFAFGGLTMSSCGNDGNGGGEIDTPGNVTTGWKENGNTITYTVKASYAGYTSTAVWTFKFTGDTCSSATLETTYPSSEIAQGAWDDMDADDRMGASISGKTITENWDDIFVGFTKDEIKSMVGMVRR